MSDIKIDMKLLAQLESDLAMISSEFSRAEEISHTVASYVGHNELEGVVRDFASQWNVHRKKVEEKLVTVREATTAIHDTFLELDRRLAEKATNLYTTPGRQSKQGEQ